MSTHYRFQWETIEKASENRPAGYKEDILRTGFVHSENGKPEYVILTAEQYQALRSKYSGGALPPTEPLSPTPEPVIAPTHGPGTELKAILKDWLGIQASPNCSCNARAKQMDEWGPDLCEQNLSTIVDWLGEQAAARKLPFVRFAAEQAVKLAIRRARKKAAK